MAIALNANSQYDSVNNNQSSVDSAALLQYYIDNANSVRVVQMEPNEMYLKYLNHIYIPSVEVCETEPFQLDLLESFLESRYKCSIDFIYEDSTNGVRDMVFEVAQKKELVFSVLLLKLSLIEQLYQEGELINQVNEYSKWMDKIVNF